jgi:hypothetical protein
MNLSKAGSDAAGVAINGVATASTKMNSERNFMPPIHHRAMPGLVPGIHALNAALLSKARMAGTSPAMTFTA